MKLLAFQISVPSQPEAGAEVVFAQDAEEAIQSATLYTSADWEQGLAFEICRAPELDEYGPGPVPTSVLLEAGWSVSADELGDEVLAFIRAKEGR